MKTLGWVFCFLALGLLPAHAQKLTWSRLWGSTNFNSAKDIARGRDGYFYVAGSTSGNFDGQTNNGTYDAFLSKFDTNGVRLWTRIWGSSGDDEATGVIMDRQTNVYVCGQTVGSFDGETNTQVGTLDLFVTKWTSDGTRLWTRIWGSPNDDDAAGIVYDSVNDVYIGGTTKGTFGTVGQTNAKVGLDDFCLTKYSSSGSFQWSRIWGCTNNDTCHDIAKDPNGEYLFLAGTTHNGIFDGQTNYSPVYNINRLALTSYDTSGNRLWSRVWGATNKENVATCVAAESWVYVGGYTQGSFDGQTNHSTGFNTDFFISQFESDGSARNWTRIHGTSSIEQVFGVAQDSYANPYVVGTAFGNLDGQTRAGAGCDFLMVKYDTSGNRLWTRLWGGPTDDGLALGIALDGTNGIYVCGDTDESFGGQTNPSPIWGSAFLTRYRQGPNVIPSASITRPVANREFIQLEAVACAGSGTDTDDGSLTNLQWRCGTNSTLSYGTTTTVSSASVGSQTVTLYAVDTEFATGKSSVVVTVLQDGGGLPEVWQTNYWPQGDSGGPANDSDFDGVDNRTEWESGTDPTSSQSVFKCNSGPAAAGTPQIVIQWPSTSNRDYAISSSANLPAGFSPLVSVPPTPPMNTYTTPASADPQIYYRVEVGR